TRLYFVCFFFQAEDGIRDRTVTGVQTCALPISSGRFGKFLKRGSRCACDSSMTGARAAAAEPVIPSPRRMRGRRDISSIGVPCRSEERRVGKEGTARGAA